MRVVSVQHLRDFYGRRPDAAPALKAWTQEARSASWTSPQDIKQRYASASFLKGNRVVFNLKGNDYRLVVAVAYRFGIVCLKFIGTHSEYAAIDAQTVEMHP